MISLMNLTVDMIIDGLSYTVLMNLDMKVWRRLRRDLCENQWRS